MEKKILHDVERVEKRYFDRLISTMIGKEIKNCRRVDKNNKYRKMSLQVTGNMVNKIVWRLRLSIHFDRLIFTVNGEEI